MEFDYQFPIPEDGKLFDEKKRVQVGNASGVIEMEPRCVPYAPNYSQS